MCDISVPFSCGLAGVAAHVSENEGGPSAEA